MKNRYFVLLATMVIIAFSISVYGDSSGVFSKEKAIYAAQQNNDFGKLLFYKQFSNESLFKNGSFRLPQPANMSIYASNKGITHIIAYETKPPGDTKIIIWDE